MESETGSISTRVVNGIGEITFSHPQSNSLPGALLRSLALEIEMMGNDGNAKVIVLKSAGEKSFCAGASFDELISIKNSEEGKHFFSGFAGVINAMRKAPKFILVRVQGKAVGGGVGIAAAADYTMATENSSVKLSELAVGIGPFVVGPAVERKIGMAAFSGLTINATQWKDAKWAMEKGLFAEIYKDIDQLDDAINQLANTLSGSNPEAMSMLKKIMWEGTENWDSLLIQRAEMSGKLVLSEFTKESIGRFKAKN